MKKFIVLLIMCMMVFVVGCADEEQQNSKLNKSDDVSKEGNVTEEKNEQIMNDEDEKGDDEVVNEIKKDLTLHVMKVDEEAGISLENSEFYQAIKEVIESDPQMGDPNDISLFPYSVIEKADGQPAVLFLMINRLGKPIQNIVFDFTFGNQEGEYIYDDMEVELPEEVMGILDDDGVTPLLLDIDEADVELFLSLEQEDIFMELDNVGIDFIE